MKTSVQLKALIRNLSKETGIEAEVILRRFMLERFLERVSVSSFRNRFILKGGVLVSAMLGVDTRTIMDLDATITSVPLNESDTEQMLTEILGVRVDDNVILAIAGIEQIRDEADYPGFRVSIRAVFDRTRQIYKVDLTTGDLPSTGAVNYGYRLMFEEREISLLAYSVESVLAEKFETTVSRGTTNTRMRDIYDIYMLTSTYPYDTEVFCSELDRTCRIRGTTIQMQRVLEIVQTIAISEIMIGLWRSYQRRYDYAADVSWDGAVKALYLLADTQRLTRKRHIQPIQ